MLATIAPLDLRRGGGDKMMPMTFETAMATKMTPSHLDPGTCICRGDVKANNNLGQLLIRVSSDAGLHLKNPLRVTAGARGRCLIR